ncbi:MAG: glycosyltransferase family 87 protein [Polyangiales bacterium]
MPASSLEPGWLSAAAAVALLGSAALAIREGRTGRAWHSASYAYLACSAAAVGLWDAVFRSTGHATLDVLRSGPISNLRVTLVCTLLAWLTLGSLLVQLRRAGRSLDRLLFVGALHALALLYLNVMRERTEYGDFFDFAGAAWNLAHGQALHPRYLYPPLFATLLQPLASADQQTMFVVCFVANFGSLVLFFALLQRTLLRYGFSHRAATLATFAMLVVNVAVLRTLFYVQTNFHVANLALLSLLLYPVQPWLSAIALGVAAHLKTSPLVLVLPFVFARDWKWLAWFAAAALGIVALTSYANGFVHYSEYLSNVAHIYRANPIEYRENSIDSFLRATSVLLGHDPAAMRIPTLVTRALVLVALLWLWRLAVRRRAFSAGRGGAEAVALDSYPVLLLLMMSVSPLVWEHHPVLIVPTFLVLLGKLEDATDAVLWLLAWFLVLATPTFDLYPFSYHLLAGEALIAWLLVRAARRGPGRGRFVQRAEHSLAAMG